MIVWQLSAWHCNKWKSEERLDELKVFGLFEPRIARRRYPNKGYSYCVIRLAEENESVPAEFAIDVPMCDILKS